MKRYAIAGLLICAAAVLINAPTFAAGRFHTEKMGDQLVKVFQSSKAASSGYAVHDWTRTDTQFHSLNELKQQAQQLNQALQIPNPQEDDIVKPNQNLVQLHGKWSGNRSVSLIFTSLKDNQNKSETTLVIRVEKEVPGLEDYTESVDKVQSTLKHVKGTPNFSTCIEGILDGRMTNVERNRLIQNMLSAVKAKEVEGMRSDLVTSVSAFSDQIPGYIETNGNKMNLQVAVHDDAAFQKTRVVVGAPIITITY